MALSAATEPEIVAGAKPAAGTCAWHGLGLATLRTGLQCSDLVGQRRQYRRSRTAHDEFWDRHPAGRPGHRLSGTPNRLVPAFPPGSRPCGHHADRLRPLDLTGLARLSPLDRQSVV